MQVIPVIDLKGGQVVHARQGARDTYRPIETPLCCGSAPLDVVAGLLRLHAFGCLYVADLDAIAGGAGHAGVLADMARAWPDLQLWVDAGIGTLPAAHAWLAQGVGHLVIGSESQSDLSVLQALATAPRTLLSLDFRGEAFQGPAALLQDAASWPARLIVMTLARVGASAGPDIPRLREIAARAGSRDVYAAGGVRHGADLAALADAGAAGVLVATALHSGAVSVTDLQRSAGPSPRPSPRGRGGSYPSPSGRGPG